MASLESYTKNSAEKYITASKEEVGLKKTEGIEEKIIIDETTERILVSIAALALAALPLITIASKLLPEIPLQYIYQIYRIPY